MGDAVENGAFGNIRRVELNWIGTVHLSIDTVILFLKNCEFFKTIGELGTWRHISPEDIVLLDNRVVMENLDLKMLK